MAKTRSQTGNISIKKEEEDRKPTLCLNGVATATRNKIAKREPPTVQNRNLRAQQVKVEEDTDTKPLLKSLPKRTEGRSISQEQINQLIDYVANHGMSVTKASRTVKVSKSSGFHYYNVYRSDPEKKIPSTRSQFVHYNRFYTEDIENLIKGITEDKMKVKEASAKAHMSCSSGYKYYKRYLQDPNRHIPILYTYQKYTPDQKNVFIGYIVNDKMSITAASKKAKMSTDAGRKYYYEYFKDQNPDIATPSHIVIPRHYKQEQIKELISYIVGDKMTLAAASRKANIHRDTARKYYLQYLKDCNMEYAFSRNKRRYTQDVINEFIGYVVNEKMSMRAASKKANINYKTSKKYYHRYRKEHNLEAPTRRYTQDQVKELICYIVDDKMSIIAASKKARFSITRAYIYYRRYLKAKKSDTPTPHRRLTPAPKGKQ